VKAPRLLATTKNIHEATPEGFYKQLNEEFHFDFDPCPLHSEQNALLSDWGRTAYINPPYGKAIRGFLEKALLEIKKGNMEIAVFLLPAYTDVKWFHEIVLPYSEEIRFIKGRLKFGEHSDTAPFASMIVVFKSKTGVK
jgi:site-specific DNA-methyltransferase (adenine-specific)